MRLREIYRPITKELAAVERMIGYNIKSSGNRSILMLGSYILHSGGKRLRPALVTLSARAVMSDKPAQILNQVIKVAAAVELIHTASLIHDDVVDHSAVRHSKPTINAKWGQDVSLILGDYLYSLGFDLISSCDNPDVLTCISQAARMMCEGELIQVCERDNLKLLKERYITIVKNKTANLFAASCQAGVLAVDRKAKIKNMLKDYGLNFGIAFQIADDSMDLIGSLKELGKSPGADFKMGELTLPFLNLISVHKNKNKIFKLIAQKDSKVAFEEIRRIFIDSGALAKTKDDAAFYANRAKKSLRGLEDSAFKESLFDLADYMVDRIKTPFPSPPKGERVG